MQDRGLTVRELIARLQVLPEAALDYPAVVEMNGADWPIYDQTIRVWGNGDGCAERVVLADMGDERE